MTAPLDVETLLTGGKRALARALTLAETNRLPDRAIELLDTAFARPRGHVLGLTGTPGVGKSTLVSALVQRRRAEGTTVGVVAVDPSSRKTGGALLGDRARIATDPADEGVFVRSLAARDRLGGLSETAIRAVVLMRAVYDAVILESVGIGQSESDIAFAADTVVLCLQPGSGDALQFMKAGVMELPHVIAVTKADMGPVAVKAKADVAGALSLGVTASGEWVPPIVSLSATRAEGLDALDEAIAAHRAHLAEAGRLAAQRRAQALAWLEDAVRLEFGRAGRARLPGLDLPAPDMRPFAAIAAALAALSSLQG
jgi:LAO/AO transport system kinase